MALSIDWPNKIVTVPKDYTQLVQSSPFEIRQLDLDNFRLDLRNLEADFEGIGWPKTHKHNTTVTVGGVTLARVIEIVNGYTVTFEDGSYAVNLVGANSNVADVTNLNNVQVRSANSAGLTFSDQINNQSFTNNKVYVNQEKGLSGTSFPRGTPTDPVNNIEDAHLIAERIKLNTYDLTGTFIAGAFDHFATHQWESASPLLGVLVFSGQNVDNATFMRLAILGASTGRASYEECFFPSGISGLSGVYARCGFKGTSVLSTIASPTGTVTLLDCFSSVVGVSTPTFECSGCPNGLSIRGWTGGIQFNNIDTGIESSVDMRSGTVKIDPSCTNGLINVRGDAIVVNADTGEQMPSGTYFGGLTIINNTSPNASAERVWSYTRD